VLPDGIIYAGDSIRKAHIRWESEEVQCSRNFNSSNAIADVQFAINFLYMSFDRIDGDHQVAGDFAIRATGSQQPQHPLLLG